MHARITGFPAASSRAACMHMSMLHQIKRPARRLCMPRTGVQKRVIDPCAAAAVGFDSCVAVSWICGGVAEGAFDFQISAFDLHWRNKEIKAVLWYPENHH